MKKITTTTAIAVSAAVMFAIISICNSCGKSEAIRAYNQQVALRHTDSLTISAQAAQIDAQATRIQRDSTTIASYQADERNIAVLATNIQKIISKHQSSIQTAGDR